MKSEEVMSNSASDRSDRAYRISAVASSFVHVFCPQVQAFEPIYSQIGLNYLTLCSTKTDICAFAFNISRFAEQTLIQIRWKLIISERHAIDIWNCYCGSDIIRIISGCKWIWIAKRKIDKTGNEKGMAYIVCSTERWRAKGADYETKALLYLMGGRDEMA